MTAPRSWWSSASTARPHPEWSDEEALTLLDLVEEGNSYSLCAHVLSELGFPPRSRNACIGKVDRINRAADAAELPAEA